MALAERKANVVWNGNLTEGSGTLTLDSGAAQLPVGWSARVEQPGGKTSPEELIAGALATCYSQAFANTLQQAGHPPEQLSVDVHCRVDQVEGGLKVTEADINVSGTVPGLDQPGFADLANKAEQGCPVANALRNNVRLSVAATLSG
jgi:osmotically inducible protein OsmC